MTYQELLQKLQSATQEQLRQDATIYVSSKDEFFPISSFEVVDPENDVLDEGHLILIAKE
ncbi:MAG: hypothetical protein ABFD50_04655 [Smithella sp.]